MVSLQRETLNLCPTDHPERSNALNNLAVAVRAQYVQNGELRLLQEVIALHREALTLRPNGHPKRSATLNNLAIALRTQFEQLGGNLNELIALHREALKLCPSGHPKRSSTLMHLSIAVQARYRVTKKKADLGFFIDLLEYAAIDEFSSLVDRFSAALFWTSAAREHRHTSAIQAYSTALNLFELCLITIPTFEKQLGLFTHRRLQEAKNLASSAASYAIEIGNTERAVEMLERGRGLLWSQMRGFRSPLDRLREVDTSLADQFSSISRALEVLAISLSDNAPQEYAGDGTGGIDNSATTDTLLRRKRLLLQELNEIISKIRATQGFDDFLRAKPFATLQTAAIHGPVILVNRHESRSDGIIILHDRAPIIIPLSSSFHKDIAAPYSLLMTITVRTDRPYAAVGKPEASSLGRILYSLWKLLVQPVVEKLKILNIPEQSRIWWCPTSVLSALPIHAAGPISRGESKYLCDIYVSSYTPTLSALITARGAQTSGTGNPSKVLAVAGPRLKMADEELNVITAQLGGRVTGLVNQAGTRLRVLQQLEDHPWAHFACHGHLSVNNPFRSSFELHEGSLTLLDIIQARLPSAELAFLSACHSAASDEKKYGIPDEVLHLAAAVQFCGFQSVIGTLWQMEDIDGPEVARHFYKYMGSNDGLEHSSTRSAMGLYDAIKKIREKYGMTLQRWVTFIHIGA
ncbi:hypothetical protein PHLCEN_2v4208 [Hermanssonia centrifuga]|uniref:CHAT domain-containing protein n=1 Tax=Hermanssonia centrifuga TaxID=98765 RepID=A0A2R6PYZ0_9APHY|nr:hypothetical protein PHLCEN_2v4208 [Hermanssonia centrifuga]